MFSDSKENELSCKHTRNLRREIKTTGKKENDRTKIHYLKKLNFIGRDFMQNW